MRDVRSTHRIHGIKRFNIDSLGLFSRRQIGDIFFIFFQENMLWHFMQIVFEGDNLLEMSKPFFLWEKKKKTKLEYRLLKFLPCMLSVNMSMSFSRQLF